MERGADRRLSQIANMDLAMIVTRLNRVRSKNRARLANSDLTRAFLDAALALADEAFQAGSVLASEGTSPTATYLSRARVLSRTQADRPELVPTEAKFRDRWSGQQAFFADFVSYALNVRRMTLELGLEACMREVLEANLGLSASVHRFTADAANVVLSLPAHRLHLFALAAASADPGIGDPLRRFYTSTAETWLGLSRRLVESAGLSLRPGASVGTFSLVVQAVVEGAGLHALAGLEEVSHEGVRTASVVETAMLALIAALVDDGDGLTIEQAVDRRSDKIPPRSDVFS